MYDNEKTSDQGKIAKGFSFISTENEPTFDDYSTEQFQGICYARPIDLSQWIYLQQSVMISLQFDYTISVDQIVHVCLMRKTDNRFEILNPPINVSNMVSTSYQDISICKPEKWEGDELFLGFIQKRQQIAIDRAADIQKPLAQAAQLNQGAIFIIWPIADQGRALAARGIKIAGRWHLEIK